MWAKTQAVEATRREREQAAEAKRRDREQKKQIALERTREAEAAIRELETLLVHTLSVDDRVDWESLKDRTPFPVPNAPVLRVDSDDFVVGKIEGNFEVARVLGPRTFIASKIDRDGIPEYSVWVEGISTAGVADQKKFTFTDDAVFQHKGTTSYKTVLGALRTIYSVEALDSSLGKYSFAANRPGRIMIPRNLERTCNAHPIRFACEFGRPCAGLRPGGLRRPGRFHEPLR